MKRTLLFVLSIFCILQASDDLDNLAQALKRLANEAELFKSGSNEASQPTQPVSPCKLLIVEGLCGCDKGLLQDLVAENKKRNGALFSGEIEFGQTNDPLKVNDPHYKVIFLYTLFRTAKILLFRHDGSFYDFRDVVLGGKRGCMVMRYEKKDSKLMTTHAINTLRLAVPAKKEFCTPFFIQKPKTSFFGLFDTGYELSEIYWPEDMPQSFPFGVTKKMESDYYSDKVKTIYDWLLWY